MIGLVGPADSVEHVAAVAQGMGLDLVTRSYETPDTAVSLTDEIRPLCRIILYTGVLPYQAVLRERPQWAPDLMFIAHTATDLYRCVARLLVTREEYSATRRPAIAVDVLASATVTDVLVDIGLDPPRHCFPVFDRPCEDLSRPVEAAIAQHKDAHRKGEVGLSLTCLGSVYRALQEADLPVVRITHTKTAIRDALRRAKLTESVREAETRQVTVVMVRCEPENLEAASRDFARTLGGSAHQTSPNTFVVHSTRGRVEAYLDSSATSVGRANTPWAVAGFGVAPTPKQAKVEAEWALDYAEQRGQPLAVFENGAPIDRSFGARFDGEIEPRALQEQAEHLGISPVALHRLIEAIGHFDPAHFTAQDLAVAYGATTRTARRLISSLRARGYVEHHSFTKGLGAGRPSPVYALRVSELTARPPKVASPGERASSRQSRV